MGEVHKGWKLVPVEPTPEMVEAAFDSLEAYSLEGSIRRHYRAMLAAAPAAPQAEQQAESPQERLTTEHIWELERQAYVDNQRVVYTENHWGEEVVEYKPTRYFNLCLFARAIERTLATRWGVKLKENP